VLNFNQIFLMRALKNQTTVVLKLHRMCSKFESFNDVALFSVHSRDLNERLSPEVAAT